MKTPDKPLTMLPVQLAQFTGAAPPSYRHAWDAVVGGRLPMVERRGSRWYFREADVPAIAEALGLERVRNKAAA